MWTLDINQVSNILYIHNYVYKAMQIMNSLSFIFINLLLKCAQEDPLEEKQLTYKETHDMVETIASNLIKHGFDAEKPISIYMTNCLEYLLVTMAAWRLGGKVAVINPLLTPSKYNSISGYSGIYK